MMINDQVTFAEEEEKLENPKERIIQTKEEFRDFIMKKMEVKK